MPPAVAEVAAFLDSSFCGFDFEIKRPCSLDNPVNRGITFRGAKSGNPYGELLDDPWDTSTICQALFLTPRGRPGPGSYSWIEVDNPRLAFARVLSHFFSHLENDAYYCMPPFSHVMKGQINTIADCVTMGEHCTIKSGAIIGEPGFGFEFDEDGHPVRFPHIGGVQIGSHVEIGANTVICRGALDDTVIHDHVKLDDLVFVAHNVKIGENTLVIAHAEISGSVKIGRDCWIGPGAKITDHVTIGDGAQIGIGSVVLNDVPAGEVWVGNPARFLRERIKS